jgi:hypothetical protein
MYSVSFVNSVEILLVLPAFFKTAGVIGGSSDPTHLLLQGNG